MSGHPDMFPMPAREPRKAARVLMHVIDAGDSGCDDGNAGIAVFKCFRCGHQTDWTGFRTFTEAKMGLPCPRCNPSSSNGE